LNERENLLKAACFDKPDYIPLFFGVNKSCWHHYPIDILNQLMSEHNLLFPDFKPVGQDYRPDYSLVQLKDKPYTDPFGCLWETPDDGITGVVKGHPLADWDKFDTFTMPDPDKSDGLLPIQWEQKKREFETLKKAGKPAIANLRHGHTFLELSDLRGYENLLFDMVDVEEFNLELVKRWLHCSPDMMMYPDDLGMQKGPMLPVDKFRKYIKPSYQKLMAPARHADVPVHMHSDGDLRDLAEDIIEAGVQILNLQDLVNGIDWIKENLQHKVCIDLDIDRQNITASGSPEQIDELIQYEVKTLGSRQGGLMLTYGLYPGVPVDNVKAVMDAMERYAGHFS